MDTKNIAFVLIALCLAGVGYSAWNAYASIDADFSSAIILIENLERLGVILTLTGVAVLGALVYYVVDSRGIGIVSGILFAVLFVGACFPALRAAEIGEQVLSIKTSSAGSSFDFCKEVAVPDTFLRPGGEFRVYVDRSDACRALMREMDKEDWSSERSFFETVEYINDWYAERDQEGIQQGQDVVPKLE